MHDVTPVRTAQYDLLPVEVYGSNEDMGRAAALQARRVLNQAIAERGQANIIFATGNSQVTFLETLRDLDGIDWSRVNVLHIDNYLGLPPVNRADIPPRLGKHILDAVKPGRFFPLDSNPASPEDACREYAALLHEYPADLIALGWGMNGHMGFNDPPFARFDDPEWVRVVTLAETSKQQVVGEGRFDSVADVPDRAITMTVPALIAARTILAIVPEGRKAEAVRACLVDPVSEARPGSILRTIPNARLYLDLDSASKI